MFNRLLSVVDFVRMMTGKIGLSHRKVLSVSSDFRMLMIEFLSLNHFKCSIAPCNLCLRVIMPRPLAGGIKQ